MTDDPIEALLLDVRDRFQRVENILLAHDRSSIIVVTNAGTFEWKRSAAVPSVTPGKPVPE